MKEIDREKLEIKVIFLISSDPVQQTLTFDVRRWDFTRFCLLTKDYCLDKYEKDRMENDWELVDHAHLQLI